MPTLCDRCAEAFRVRGHSEWRHLRDLCVAIENGCRMCAVVYATLKELPALADTNDFDYHVKASIYDGIGPHNHRPAELVVRLKRPPERLYPSTLVCRQFLLLEHTPSLDHGFEIQQADDTARHRLYKNIPSNTSAPEVEQLALSWLQECLNHHSECGPPDPCGPYPLRLLDVEQRPPRLVLTESQPGPNGGYATLSHCWGPDAEFITLTKSRLREFSQIGISHDEMPANFRDAISICRWLKIKWLWIDSLCIIQSGEGSTEDWLYHVNCMMTIYKFCQVCICSSASRATETCFRVRNPHGIAPLLLKSPGYNDTVANKRYILVPKDLHLRGHRSAPLARRGWALQERLLSPRVLTIGLDQLFWQCYETRDQNVCESFPQGCGFFRHNYASGLNVPIILPGSSPFSLPSPEAAKDNEANTERINGLEENHNYWRELVHSYSQCALTRADEDKFAAFAGIAQHMSRVLGVNYIAGFFDHEFLQHLLWRVPADKRPPHRPNKSDVYRSPSWSWAALDSAVEFPNVLQRRKKLLATLELVNVELVEPRNPFGPLKHAEITVKAPICNVSWDKSWWPGVECLTVDGSDTWCNVFLDSQDVQYEDQRDVRFMAFHYESEEYIGLLVRRLEGAGLNERDRYVRLGTCMIMLDNSNPWITQNDFEEITLV